MAWGGSNRAALGASAEECACAHLRRHGVQILQRNYRVRGGEIDIVARDADCLVFVEVRMRRKDGHGGAAASVDARKRARLAHAARHFLMRLGDAELRCRFDVIAIDGASLRWLRGAFDEPGALCR